MDGVTLGFEIVRKRDPERVVFGWAVLATKRDGSPLVDLQGDVVSLEDLERVAWEYAESLRKRDGDGGEMHDGPAPFILLESFIVTPEKCEALGIAKGTLPYGWLVTYRVPVDTYKRVELGARVMFSIEGGGVRSVRVQDPPLAAAA